MRLSQTFILFFATIQQIMGLEHKWKFDNLLNKGNQTHSPDLP